MGVPVVTVIGSLSSSENQSASIPLPADVRDQREHLCHGRSRHQFHQLQRARYAARVRYADGSHRIFIIPKELPSKDRAYYFSFNLPIADKPVEVSLYRLQHPYAANDFPAILR
jgi:hypothetical protein